MKESAMDGCISGGTTGTQNNLGRTCDQEDPKRTSTWRWPYLSTRGRWASSDGNESHTEQPRWYVSSPATCR